MLQVLLQLKQRTKLKGGIHGSTYVHESKYFFSDFLLILSVKSPTHIYFSNHILKLAQAECWMTKIHRKYQQLTPTLLTLNLVLTRSFYSTVDKSLAICTLVSRVPVGVMCD